MTADNGGGSRAPWSVSVVVGRRTGSTKRGGRTDAAPVVMVLEPDVLVRMTIAEVLRDCGYKVIEGIVADDLWTLLEAGSRLDVVFTEVRLRGAADGFALARRLRQDHPEIDVIPTSGIDSAAEKSRDLCDEGPVKKPYRTQDVVARIQLLLERRRAARRRRAAGSRT
jgi:DNA-binding response OmpR family regulator